MMRPTAILATLALMGCPPKQAPEAPADAEADPERTMPGPLETPSFEMPATETRELSNGITVVVATNDEVPLFDLRVAFDVGGWADPAGEEGLASVTFDMLNEGAGDMGSEEISRQLKQLGSTLYTGADDDSAQVGASGLVRNLEPTLDIWATVLTEPTFPAEEWEIVQKRRIADVKARREDPVTVARQVSYQVLYGDHYRGRYPTEATYEAMSPEDMRGFYDRYVGPENAKIFVGGAVTADEIMPLLEERIGSWAPEGVEDAEPEPVLDVPDDTTVYFVDEPGAAQSVLRVMIPVGTRTDDDYFPLYMANQVLGGQFTSRLNMNLREDKGFTYGARCFVGQWYGPGVWGCATSVQTEVTGPALQEMKREIEAALGDRPVSEDELAYFTSMQVNSFPANYETTGAILDEQASLWLYGLPSEWPEEYLDNIEAVTTEGANQAFAERVDPQRLTWVVVGDRDKVYDELSVLGVEDIVELDKKGNPIEQE